MRFKAGIFDLGKVVVHSDDKVLLEDIKKTLDLTDKQLKEVIWDISNLIQTGQISEADYLRKLLSRYGIKKEIPKDLLKRSFENDFEFIDPTIEVIKNLKAKRIKLAALSNTSPQHIKVMKKRGVFEYFDVEVLSSEVGFKKPDLRIYELTLDRLGSKAEQTFFVDDREENVNAARKLGIKSFLYESPQKLKKDLSELGLIIN